MLNYGSSAVSQEMLRPGEPFTCFVVVQFVKNAQVKNFGTSSQRPKKRICTRTCVEVEVVVGETTVPHCLDVFPKLFKVFDWLVLKRRLKLIPKGFVLFFRQ